MSGMPTVSVTRPDAFPEGTSVGFYPATARREGQPPTAAAIATGTVTSNVVSVTNAGLLQGVDYVAYASVGGQHRYVTARSTLDGTDRGKAIGTANTTSGSAALASVTATSGAFAVGQRITGPGIPPGTYLVSGSGASWTMSDKATATATGAAVEAYGASPATVPSNKGSGALAVPTAPSNWRARVMQRRAISGTS